MYAFQSSSRIQCYSGQTRFFVNIRMAPFNVCFLFQIFFHRIKFNLNPCISYTPTTSLKLWKTEVGLSYLPPRVLYSNIELHIFTCLNGLFKLFEPNILFVSDPLQRFKVYCFLVHNCCFNSLVSFKVPVFLLHDAILSIFLFLSLPLSGQMASFQSKVLRHMLNAHFYITNSTIQDSIIFVPSTSCFFTFYSKLPAHPNPLGRSLSWSETRHKSQID